MILKKRFFILLAIFLIWGSVSAQGVVDAYLTHRVTLNEPEQTVVAYVKPVKIKTVNSGQQYYWFSKGHISNTQGGYSGKVLNGAYQVFYTNKSLKESGHFAAGLKTGSWKRWTESGLLQDEYTWSAGRKAGGYALYDSLGRVSEKGAYRKDLLHGKQYLYAADKTTMIRYKNGKVKEPRKIKMPAFLKKIFKKKAKPAAQ